MNYLYISELQLALAAGLLLINVGLSAALRLGLEKTLLWAAARMVVQLLLVGVVLGWVFQQDNPWVLLGIAAIMALAAGRAAVRRTKRRFAGIFWNSFLSVITAGFLITGVAVTGILNVDPWYAPQYVIPMLGMVLGNALNGVSLALDRFLEDAVRRRGEVETRLSLGASAWEAALPLVQDAVRTGMTPIVNTMVVMGLVSLPGMMTGQILAGADPQDAVRYQIVITFMIASGTALASLGVVLLAFRLLFSGQRLNSSLLSKNGKR